MLPFRLKLKRRKPSCGFLHTLSLEVREKIYALYFGRPFQWTFYTDLWPVIKSSQQPQAVHLRASYMVSNRKFRGSILATCRRIQREASATLNAQLTLILSRYVTMDPLRDLCSADQGLLHWLQALSIDIAVEDLPSRAPDIVARLRRLPHLTNVTIRCSAAIWAFETGILHDFPRVFISPEPTPEPMNNITFDQA
jgi:hypothetical protein